MRCSLFHRGKNFNNITNKTNELESFYQAASKLGITSSRAALRERTSLKKLIDSHGCMSSTSHKEIVAIFLHLVFNFFCSYCNILRVSCVYRLVDTYIRNSSYFGERDIV